MSNINKDAVLNPFSDLTANILDYVPRATTSEFGIVAIGSGINVDALGRIYLDTQEYSDRLAAIEAQAASSLATQQTEVAAAIAQVNLTQSQTITALTLEVDTLKTNLTNEIAATQTDLINRADQLAQDVTDITDQLALDKAAFTQEIQDALVYLEGQASTATALRTPRKIQGVDFDGTQDINLPIFTSEIDGLVPKRVGATTTKYLREDGSWVVPPNTTYALLTQANAEAGTATTANTISAKVLKDAIQYHAPTVTDITGNAGTATKLQTPRTINGVLFDGSQDISLPEAEAYSLPTASASVLGGIKVGSGLAISNSVLSVATLNQDTTGNAATATKLQTARNIGISGSGVSGSVSFDGTANINIPLAVTTQASTTNDTTIATTAFVQAVNSADTGSAATALTLKTARTIGGVSFNGSADINLPGVNIAGNQNTSGNAATATNVTGTVAIANGGTGGTSAAEARTNLDVYSKDEVNTAITTSVPIAVDATTTDKGIVRLATESDITNSSETSVVTPKNVADMLVSASSLTKSFCALFSARLIQMAGSSSANGQIVTCIFSAHGLVVGDIISISYRYKTTTIETAVDIVTVTSVADTNTFTFTSPRVATGYASASASTLFYVIRNSYNVGSLVINSTGRHTITFNAAAGITDKTFVPFVQATLPNNAIIIAQTEEITSATSLTVCTFNMSGTLVTPQWLHIGVTQ